MLQIRNLAVAYGKREIISDISVDGLVPGTVTSLLGPNGTGKSTLLKALAGMARTPRGEIVLDGVSLSSASLESRARQVVYLPQSLPAAVHLHVFESVLVAGNAAGHGSRRDRADVAQVYALLERLGIGHLAMRYLDQLSGGQKQLVGLAQALIRKPRLLLLDEPLSALDLNYQFHVMDLLRDETRHHGLITVIVLHDVNIALRHTDHALLVRDGKLVGDGAPQEVVTPASLAEVYGVDGRIEYCSRGVPQVLIDGLCEAVS